MTADPLSLQSISLNPQIFRKVCNTQHLKSVGFGGERHWIRAIGSRITSFGKRNSIQKSKMQTANQIWNQNRNSWPEAITKQKKKRKVTSLES